MREMPSYVTRVEFAVPDAILPPMHALLKKQPAYEIIKPGIASGYELIEDVNRDHPDILILDLALPRLNIIDVVTALSGRKMRPYVLIIAPLHDLTADIQSYRAVRGVLPRHLADTPVLHHVLIGLIEGCRYFMSLPASDPSLFHLNKSETVLLALMVLGLSPSELTHEMSCTLNALYIRQNNLRKKLEVDSSPKAMLKAIKTGLAGALTDAGERGKTKGVA